MKRLLPLLCLLALVFSLGPATAQDSPAELRQRAEQYRAEGSFELARRDFAALLQTELSADDSRAVRVALEDCRWRASAAAERVDQPELDAARIALEAIVAEYGRPELRDVTWAVAQAALADYHWTRRWNGHWDKAWPHYEAALSFWESSADVEHARRTYLDIARVAIVSDEIGSWQQRNHSRNAPLALVEKAARVAVLQDDIGWTQLYLALAREPRGPSAANHRKTRDAFEAAIASEAEPWVDHALYRFGVWLEERGEFLRDEEGVPRTRPDYVQALEVQRRYLTRYKRRTGVHWMSARERVNKISGTEVSLTVDGAFMPGSATLFRVGWRNTEDVELRLTSVDLGRDVRLASSKHGPGDWLQQLDAGAQRPVHIWKHATEDDGKHRRGEALLEIPIGLDAGAYLLTASAGKSSSRQLVLVSDMALALKDTGDELIAWAADAADGRPRADAELTLFHRRDHNQPWKQRTGRTDADGLVRFGDLGGGRGQSFVAARSGDDQAFAIVRGSYRWSNDGQWKLYVSTDRPAYRPGDEVQWKLVARVHRNDVLATPSGETLHYRVQDPRGNQVLDGELTLNDFGSIFSVLECKPEWTLGEYRIMFLNEAEDQNYGSATLFRLEEYKLPEFTVEVSPATQDDGTPKLFRAGETVEAHVNAQYAFGGPVAGAQVEVLVHAQAYAAAWMPQRRYPWYHKSQHYRGWGHGEQIATLNLVTDEEGVARIEFLPEWAGEGDVELHFEARVTDSSRREVSGEGTVRASRAAYHVHLEPAHRVYHPGEEFEISIEARDANDRGVAAKGELLLMRQTSYEIWRDPAGRRWTGTELDRERARHTHFPPVPEDPENPGWTRIERGEHSEFIARIPATTNEEGHGEARIAAPGEGTYLLRWLSTGRWGSEITAETRAFVAQVGTHDLGYRAEGVEIFTDSDSMRAGGEAVILITTEAPGRWVLFSVEGRGLIELRVVEVTGSAKLLRLPIDQRWVPNVTLRAVAFSDGRAALDTENIVVPPEDHFLEVDVILEPSELGPGEQGMLVVTARTVDGEPVEAEIAVAVYDAMVEAIQQDPAIDPREFFYGEQRWSQVAMSSSFDQAPYRRLVSAGEQRWKDESGDWSHDGDNEVYFEAGQSLNDGFRGGLKSKKRSAGRTFGPATPGPVSSEAAALGGDFSMDAPGSGGGDGPGQGSAPTVAVRSNFSDTAFWMPDVRTGPDGTARVSWEYPDNLTTWKASARATTRASAFGIGRAEALTTKPLLVRVQAPRFLVVGDESFVSLNLNNRTDEPLRVHAELLAEGVELLGAFSDGELGEQAEWVELPPQGGKRLDWLVRANATGTARFVGTVVGEELADGVERLIPVVPYGIESLAAVSGRVSGDASLFIIDLPEKRAPETTEAVVQVAPNLALGLIDALPYLIEYPYGCTEQTLSRFVPAVVVKRTLEGFGLSSQAPLERAFGGITPEARAALFDDDHTSIDELDRVTAAGVSRLREAQHGDGSWGWWPQSDSDAWMTAYAVWGLSLARDAGVEIPAGMLEGGAEWLLTNLIDEERGTDLRAWMLHALATQGSGNDERFGAAFDRTYAERAQLAAYGKALLCLSATRSLRPKAAQVLSRNLIDGAVLTQPDVSLVQPLAGQGVAAVRAHWGDTSGWNRWQHGGVEATSFCLWALLESAPDHELIEPASQWLLANRRAAQWSNTRDTSIAVLALADFLARKGNLSDPVEYEVLVGGTSLAHERLEGDALLSGAARIVIPADLLQAGRNEIEVRRIESAAPLDVLVWASFFTQEDRIEPRGHELYLRRNYYKLVGRPTLLAGHVYDRVPLLDGERVTSGDRIECVVSIEAKTDLEYVMLEDLKPAGFEASGVQSGSPLWASELTVAEARYRFGAAGQRQGVGARDSGSGSSTGVTGRTRRVHQEWRDRNVGLFLDRLPEGVWEVRYELRAETPGRFQALPVTGEAMYVPEIRANGTNQAVEVVD